MFNTNEETITFEVLIRENKVNCTLHNFFSDGKAFEIDRNFVFPLPEDLEQASDDEIMENIWNDRVLFWAMSNRMKVNQGMADENDKGILLKLADVLENLDYTKVKKELKRL